MKQKIIYGIAALLILTIGLVAGLFLIKKNQDIREKAAPASTLSIIPASQSKNPGNSFTLNVVANTGENRVTGLDLIINYDNTAVEVTSIAKGSGISAFTNVIKNQVDNNAGKITYTAFTLESPSAVTGSGVELLVISGKVLNSASQGSYNFTFDQQTALSGSNEGQNVLTGTVKGVITVNAVAINNPTANPTVTPIVTSTPTSSGSTQKSNSTATSTAKPTPTATGSAKPTTTPTSTPKSTSASSQTTSTSQPTSPPLPVTGSATTTLVAGGFAILLLIISFVLI